MGFDGKFILGFLGTDFWTLMLGGGRRGSYGDGESVCSSHYRACHFVVGESVFSM